MGVEPDHESLYRWCFIRALNTMMWNSHCRKHTQTDIPANVTVTVKEIPHEAVVKSGSIRIAGITDEDFIRIWNYRVIIGLLSPRLRWFNTQFRSSFLTIEQIALFQNKKNVRIFINEKNTTICSLSIY